MRLAARIAPCLWFSDQAEEAVDFYTSIFDNSKVGYVVRYGRAGQEIHGRSPGSVMTIDFELDGQPFTALNGGPVFNFNEAISLQIHCDTQEEIDYFWDRLTQGGDEEAQQCGWLKDKHGLSWQVVPTYFLAIGKEPHSERTERVAEAVFRMKKPVIEELRRAYEDNSCRCCDLPNPPALGNSRWLKRSSPQTHLRKPPIAPC